MVKNLPISYELSSKAEAKEILCLYQKLYPGLGWTEQYLNWQYFENPAGHAKVWVAKSGRKIIATYAAIPHKVFIEGKIGIGWRVQDVMTRPEYRGAGIYHNLSKMAAEYLFNPHFPLNFTFPNEKSHNAFIRTGWTDLFKVPIRILSVKQSGHHGNISAKVSPILSFDDTTDQIWQSYRSRIGFAIDRSSTYLNWRYLSNPKEQYCPFRITSDENKLIVILKYYDRDDGTRWAHICDFFYSEANPKLIDCAVKHGINFALGLGCISMSCWCPPSSSLESLLNRHQFLPQTDLNRWVVVNVNSSQVNSDRFSNESRSHLAMGDSDVF